MDSAEQQVVDHLKQARNILVTVRNSPTVDLLSACIGLALALDKMDKHVAAVFSGEVPSTLEFLKPEETIEQNPDSLRDFIIALDKSKADKLRYKVEDKVVRIFITPYKTSLSQDDLQFSQGDFNVDAVVALGAHEQQELDQAITAHGRILHDATVMSINNTPSGNLGSVNWQDTKASSISELVTQLIKDLNKNSLDEQIATALLTGIVAETDRFSNEKTTPRTMSLAGDLMAAGANQQLVATQLEEEINQPLPDKPSIDVSTALRGNSQPIPPKSPAPDDGALEIDHQLSEPKEVPDEKIEEPDAPDALPEIGLGRDMLPIPEPPQTAGMNNDIFSSEFVKDSDKREPLVEHSYLVDEPKLTDNESSEAARTEPSDANPMDTPPSEPPTQLLSRDDQADNSFSTSPVEPIPNQSRIANEPFILPPSPPPPPTLSQTLPVNSPSPFSNGPPEITNQTIEKIEETVHSPHLQEPTGNADIDTARHEVRQALDSGTQPIEPLTALNASPLGSELHSPQEQASSSLPPNQVEIDRDGNLIPKSIPSAPAVPDMAVTADDSTPLDMPLPPVVSEPSVSPIAVPSPNEAAASASPPPVPPPFMPPPMHPGQ